MTEPRVQHESRSAFSMPKLGGAAHCRELVSDYGGIHRVSEDFQVTPGLVSQYVSGQLEAPFTFLLALYWQTSHGFRQAFSESHWTHQYNSFKVAEATENVLKLERVLAHAVRLLECRPDAVSVLREAIEVAKLPSSGHPPGVSLMV
jgi:hypothetical protein|nr:unnamed protein product [uncultured bacterium]